MNFEACVSDHFHKPIEHCSNQELYAALLHYTKELARERTPQVADKKKIYYISAEFLIGKLLSNNLINLGVYDEVDERLRAAGKSLAELEEMEPEPSLGNGGLGRLAACFLDSMATLGLPGNGIGLNYHFGLFKQSFKDRRQQEDPNPWMEADNWLERTDTSYQIQFGGFTLTSRLYNIAVTGYENRTNQLHLFDVESVDESIVQDGIRFDKNDIAKNLTLFLYPDDSDEEGRLLRIYQQYFMVSNGARLILDECVARGCRLYDLDQYAAIQINDTHPTMVIPELIRLLIERGVPMNDAISVVSRTCAYTNHTILAEALEKWPLAYLEKVVPQLVPILEILDDRVRRRFEDPRVAIIDRGDLVHMAHVDIHYGYSINGVAMLHTEILKNNELNHFYQLYPEKFNNKTNGITFRRWLLHCNRPLADYIEALIGPGYKKDARELEKLLPLRGNQKVLRTLLAIKQANKTALKRYLLAAQGIELDDHSIYDIQIKRLHEYKRQQMNLLYVIHKYLSIKNGDIPATPITVLFGAKAAPAYVIAKDIIHAILCVQEIVDRDPKVSPYLKVAMVGNYNVTLAEKLIPACDISEQISLASKEASGTGNMKFMLNGAVTLGTLDGANVEISELVGPKNIYIFGQSSETVIGHYEKADYVSKDIYGQDPDIREMVDFLVSDAMLEAGCPESLERLHRELLDKDWFMTLLDLKDYIKTKERAFKDYEDQMAWSEKMLVNIGKAGYFSSDRTIEEYNRDIWKLKTQ